MAERMGRIIRNLRSFARKEGEPATDVDLVMAVKEALLLVQQRIDETETELRFDPPDLPVTVRGGPVRLQQVIVNLVNNALDAMDDQAGDRMIALAISSDSGAEARLSVRDTGPGLSDAGQVFDPFFTTKPVGKGLGLGLSISYGIVQSFGRPHHRGEPPGRRRGLHRVPAACAGEGKGGMTISRVLFVDDDADVRAALGQTLELAGFQVTLCRAFIEATDHIARAFEGVVVTDVRMPGKDGLALLERVRSIDPELPVIVLTSEGDIPMAVKAMADGAYDFLEKPCPPKRLIEVVTRAMTQRDLVLENRRLKGERAAVTAAADLPEPGLSAQMEAVERHLICDALRDHGGRVSQAAAALGLPRKTMYDKVARHGIDPAKFRNGK